MMFQRNQPPTEQKMAMPFVMVLECVSMNLDGVSGCACSVEIEEGNKEDVLHLQADGPDDGCVCYAAEREDGVVFCKQRGPEERKHAEVHDHCLGRGHEHPAKVDFDVEAAVALTLGVEFRDGEEGRSG
jgi:hypothetical protein